MATTESRVGRVVISGPELFICDNLVDPALVAGIGNGLKTMYFVRKEKAALMCGARRLPPLSIRRC